MKKGKKLVNGYGLIGSFFPFTKHLFFHDTHVAVILSWIYFKLRKCPVSFFLFARFFSLCVKVQYEL